MAQRKFQNQNHREDPLLQLYFLLEFPFHSYQKKAIVLTVKPILNHKKQMLSRIFSGVGLPKRQFMQSIIFIVK